MDYSSGSLASNKFELINTAKPSTDTTNFRFVESLEIPGYEDKSENTHLKLPLGQHSIPEAAASSLFARLMIWFCRVQLCKDPRLTTVPHLKGMSHVTAMRKN